MRPNRALTYACYFSLVTYSFTVAAWGPAVSLMQETFGIGEAGIGLLRTAMFVGFTLCVFMGGCFLNRLELKFTAVLGPAALGCALTGFSFSGSCPAALLAMFAAGCAGGMLEASVNTLVSEMHGERRAYALNLLHVYFGVGAFVAPRAAGKLLVTGASWRTVYLAISACAFAAAAAFALQRFPAAREKKPLQAAGLLRFAANPAMITLGAGMFFYVGSEIGINDWIVLYLERFLSLDKLSASNTLSYYWLAMTAGRFFCTLAARFVKAESLLVIIASLSAAAAMLIFAARTPLSAAAFIALTGFFSSGIFATIIAIGGNRFPADVGAVSGILIGFSGMGNIFFPSLIGTVAQLVSLKLALAAACAMLFLLLACAAAAAKTPVRSFRRTSPASPRS
ncbi:MAG: MFS transporter [bacterium]